MHPDIARNVHQLRGMRATRASWHSSKVHRLLAGFSDLLTGESVTCGQSLLSTNLGEACDVALVRMTIKHCDGKAAIPVSCGIEVSVENLDFLQE